mmetsp:Transcript_22366/g.53009  ORF Transcript_22366/g.53009 Transcript_22366/m.53009 type:complete len:842 (+) Transcript_22366:487-3012(+)|eukprot:CAMPEP_0185804738 /NCGR_PEP_ID=MMETSP1322-20130828/3431_1 /TAXON_ID=265543 /ORGANISM="Minutocellus polymorphus, Strain RCC2270" /LENGTH=841 /DNA_ID=CAMNT_0028500729 /DNA_START=448 /DNA_END=2973 /DNA_ORIENTATION=-
MEQAAQQPPAEGDAGLAAAASTAEEAAPLFLRPRSTPSPPPPPPAATSSSTATATENSSSSDRSSSPSPSPLPLLATPLPGRVRTSSGSRSPSPSDDCSHGHNHSDDECCEDPDCTNASPTCVADHPDAISSSLILDDSAHEVEVSLVDEDDETLEEGSVDDGSAHSHCLHRAANAAQDAPATPRAAQLILEDINIQGTPGSNNNGSSDNLFQMFCGMADAMNLLEDNCHSQPQQPQQSSPLIRPVSLVNVARSNSNSNSGMPNLDLQQTEEDGNTTMEQGQPEARPSSSEQDQPNEEEETEEETSPSSKLSCSSPCRAPCPSNLASGGADQKLHEQTAIEATIGNFLSSPGEWCDGWQAWSLHMAAVCDGAAQSSGAGGSWSASCCPSGSSGQANANGNTNGSAHHLTARDHTELKTVLRNRAGDLSARRKRIHRLRRDLSPFDTVGGLNAQDGHSGPADAGAGAGSDTAGGRQHHFRSMSAANTSRTANSSPAGFATGKGGMATPPPVPGRTVKKSRSFTDAAAILARSSNAAATDDASSVVSITSSIVDAISNCDADSVTGSGVGSKGRKGGGRGGSSHRRSSDSLRKSSNGSDADGGDNGEEDLCYDSDPEHAAGNCRDLRRQSLHRPQPRLPPSESVGRFLRQGGTWSAEEEPDQDPAPSTTTIDPMNDDHIGKAVDGILHRRMMLVWHQPDGPVAVYAWIELGSQLRSALIQPKLMWKPVHETEDERGALGITNHINLHSVDLLDISRILASTKVDRKRHPLAKSKCSLSIETFDHNLLFEASCQQERDALVQGLKGLVARLASKIIVGDERVFDEYFTPFGAVVPGEAPEWARS